MQLLASLVGIAAGLGLLALVGLGLYWALAWLLGLVLALDPSLATATAIVGALCLLAALLVAGRKGPASAAHAEERAAAYAAFVELWAALIDGPADPSWLAAAGAADDDGLDLDAALRSLDHRLALWANGPVLRCHQRLREALTQGELASAAARATLATAVLAIRRELGSPGPRPDRRALEALLFPSAEAQGRAPASPPSTPAPGQPDQVSTREEPQ